MKPNQLRENIVSVEFHYGPKSLTPGKVRLELFDLCNNEQRREMGRQCSIHQSVQGNKITSVVLSAKM